MQIQGVSAPGAAARPSGPPGAVGAASSFHTLLDRVTAEGKAQPRPSRSEPDEALKEAAAKFEALFLYQLLQAMRKTVPKGGLLDSGFSGEMYTAMLDEALSEELAKAGGIGLSEILLDQLA